jgi:ferrous iron transport protein B
MSRIEISYDSRVEEALSEIVGILRGDYQMSKRIIALLLLQGDTEILGIVKTQEADRWEEIRGIIDRSA